jgi:hypothetical protein
LRDLVGGPPLIALVCVLDSPYSYGGYPECWAEIDPKGKVVGCGGWAARAVLTWLELGGRRIDNANRYVAVLFSAVSECGGLSYYCACRSQLMSSWVLPPRPRPSSCCFGPSVPAHARSRCLLSCVQPCDPRVFMCSPDLAAIRISMRSARRSASLSCRASRSSCCRRWGRPTPSATTTRTASSLPSKRR